MKKKAFTLVEIMVVMGIIAVLATLIIGGISIARKTAAESTNRTNAKSLETALEIYYAKNKKYCVPSNDANAATSPICNGDTGCGVSGNSECVWDFKAQADHLVAGGYLNSTIDTGCPVGKFNVGGGRVHMEAQQYNVYISKSTCAEISSDNSASYLEKYTHK
jgi:prepilin-type N-terminal cleavage/methylation domain-containing protein